MAKYPSLRLIILLVCLLALAASNVWAGGLVIQGSVLSPKRVAVPGLTVTIGSSTYRSEPTYTDNDGTFQIALFIRPSNPSSLYLEIYWGQDLMYRQPLERLILDTHDDRNTRALREMYGSVILDAILLGTTPR
jgi:hypothetical protein